MKRVIFDIILFVSLLILPWWVSVLLAITGIFIFNNFYEFIFSGVVVYSLFSLPSDRLIASPIFFSLSVVFLYIVVQIIKNNIILYKK